MFLHDSYFLIRGGLYLAACEFLYRIYCRPRPQFPRVFLRRMRRESGSGALCVVPRWFPSGQPRSTTGNWPSGQGTVFQWLSQKIPSTGLTRATYKI